MADIALRFGQWPPWRRGVLLAVMGMIAGLGQAPLDLWPATILSLAVVFLLHGQTLHAKSALFQAWAFGAGYFAFSLRWIVEPFLVDVARHGWMAPFALLFMAAGAALFWGLAGWVAQRLAPKSVGAFALALIAAEVLRSLILTGFPWALLGHIWISTGIAQLSAWGGPHFLTLLVALAAWACTLLLSRDRILGLVTLGLMVAVSFVMRPEPVVSMSADLPIVRLVQPNAPQSQKWDPLYRNVFVERLVRLTREGDVPDLIVWPETAVPFLLNNVVDDLSLLSEAARGAPLVFGIQRRDTQLRAFNSLVVMGPGGEVDSLYDKRHLVPFGEYIPGARLLGQLGATGLAGNLGVGFSSGEEPGPLDIPGIGAAVMLICYEGIFAEEIAYGETRPRLLLLITNDAWFGTAAGPHQHLAQARLRTIEQGLPMVRVANTGISAMIDAKGRITAALPLDMEGAIDVPLPPALTETIYSRYGDWPLIVMLLLLTVFRYASLKRNSD